MLAFAENRVEHAFNILKHVTILKTHYIHSMLHQPFTSAFIVVVATCVRVAIKLNNQLRFHTEEIDNEVSKWLLPPKLEIATLSVAHTRPENRFG
jgi:hypothetical protein